jgi:hypothetical protein
MTFIKIACKPITTMGAYPLFSKLNETTRVANVSDQSARKYKENVSTETATQGSLHLVLRSSNKEGPNNSARFNFVIKHTIYLKSGYIFISV